MSTPKHTIKKTIIELEVPTSKKAHSIQQRAGNIFHNTITKQIDELCSKYSKSNILHRIDKMEIDLGEVKVSSLEAELKQKLIQEFEAMLSGIVSDLNKEGDTQNETQKSQVELLIGFIKTGTLPWWADLKTTNILSNSLEQITTNSPKQLQQIFRELRHSEQNIRRFVNHISALTHARIFPYFTANKIDISTLYNIYIQQKSISSLSEKKKQQTFWFSAYKAFQVNSSEQSNLFSFLEYLAKELQLPTQKVSKEMHSVIKLQNTKNTDNSINTIQFLNEALNILTKDASEKNSISRNDFFVQLKSILNEPSFSVSQIQELLQHLKIKYSGEQKQQISDIIAKLQSLQTDIIRLANDLNPLVQLSKKKSKIENNLVSISRMISYLKNLEINLEDEIASARKQIDKLLLFQRKESSATSEDDKQIIEILKQLNKTSDSNILKKVLKETSLSKPLKQSEINEIILLLQQSLNQKLKNIKSLQLLSKIENEYSAVKNIAEGYRATIKSALRKIEKEEKKKNQEIEKKVSKTKSEEEIFIFNAGLVIFAPYIKYLFIALEYMEGTEFLSKEKQHRAALMLQYMCAPELEIQEYLMPLVKILCGIEPDEYIDTDFTPTEREISESESLIKIVVERAEIFKNTSNDGFRSSFILRDAKLSIQGNNWLMQVDKKTHDVLLDKIPWNFRMIKLPWMPSIVQVDW